MGIMEFGPPIGGQLFVDAAGIPEANMGDLVASQSTQNTSSDAGVGAAGDVNEATTTTGAKAMPSTRNRISEASASDGTSTSEDGGAAVNSLTSDKDGAAAVAVASEKDGAAVEVATDTDPKPEIDVEAAELVQQTSKMVSYHLNADTYIRIRESASSALHYKVCFGLIASGVPALSDVFNNTKPKVSTSGKLVFDLPEFDQDLHGLDIVLSIVHFKFHEIPSRPDVDLLYSIAQVVEKFDCSHLLVPYMEKWYVPYCVSCEAGRETDGFQDGRSRLAHCHEEGTQR